MNLFVIPGNPPAKYFYELWKNEILETSPIKKIFISSYPKIKFRQDSQSFLGEIVNFQESEFAKFKKSVEGPATIVGHSLGAFFAYEVFKRNSHLINKCIFIHPFLRSPTLRARRILRFLGTCRRWDISEKIFLGLKPVLEKFDPNLKFVTDEEISACLDLTFHEFKTIGRDKSPLEIPSELRNKMHLLYSEYDSWCTHETLNQLKQQITSIDLNSSHDFIVYPEQRKIIQASLLKTFY